MSETEQLFLSNLQTENVFPKKTIAPPLLPFKLNGCCLIGLTSYSILRFTDILQLIYDAVYSPRIVYTMYRNTENMYGILHHCFQGNKKTLIQEVYFYQQN